MAIVSDIKEYLEEETFLDEVFAEEAYSGQRAYCYETPDFIIALVPINSSEEIQLSLYDYNEDVETNISLVQAETEYPDICENLISTLHWWSKNHPISKETKEELASLIKQGKKSALLNTEYEPFILEN